MNKEKLNIQHKENQLHSSENEMKIIFEQILNSSFEWEMFSNVHGEVLFASLSCIAISGYSPEEFKAMPELYSIIVHQDDKKLFFSHKAECLAKKNTIIDDSFRIITKNGEIKWIKELCKYIEIEQLGISGFRSSIQDITLEKRTEKIVNLQKSQIEAQNKILEKIIKKLSETNDILTETTRSLEESEEKYRSFFVSSNDAIILIDLETGLIIDLNQSACELYNYNKEDLINSLGSVLSAEPDLVDFKSTQELTFIPISYHKKKDGTVFPVEITKSYFKQKGKTLITSSVRNITERIRNEERLKDAYQQLDELNSTKDKFFSIIGHDLKNPFNNVLGLSRILIDEHDILDESTFHEYHNYIYESAHLGYNLLENLLNWSRSQTGKIHFKPQHLNLREVLEESIELLKPAAKNKNISIIINIPRKHSIFLVLYMITTVFRNLTANAIKFTFRDGKIVIESKLVGNEIFLSFMDNGIGMSAITMSKIFRIDITHSTKGTSDEKGTGLGLILCQEFVERIGGKISVESIENKGSTFKLTLPVKQ